MAEGGTGSPDCIGGAPLESDIGVTVIVNGLLGSILKALSRNPDRSELAALIEKYSAKEEIKCAWLQLFGFFKNVVDINSKKPVIQITRTSYSIMVDDILKQLSEYEKSSNVLQIAIPWNYIIKEFQTDGESRGQLWETEKCKEFSDQFKNLESRMDKKHNDMLAGLKKWSDDISNMVKNITNNIPSYANVVTSGIQIPPSASPSVGNSFPYLSFVSSGRHLAPPPFSENGARSRSNSNKRRRVDDGAAVVEPSQQQQSANNKSNQSSKKKSVVGTSNSLITGRKMKSPPADIFV